MKRGRRTRLSSGEEILKFRYKILERVRSCTGAMAFFISSPIPTFPLAGGKG